MSDQDNQNLTETVFQDPNWIAANGGFLHSNNVLFYFGISPFCDPTSKNTAIFVQSLAYEELVLRNLRDKQTFESRLRERPGIEYVVAHDPLESQVRVQGPTGLEQSRIWVIRKQNREKPGTEDKVTPLAYYYIVNDAIFQAPAVGDVLTNRLLTTVTSLSSMLSATHGLAFFSPSRGHSYSPPVRKLGKPARTGLSQRSKESSLAPGSQNPNASQSSSADGRGTVIDDAQTLLEAMRMTMKYGREYMDELPLVGEPGNFRVSKQREALGAPSTSSIQASRIMSQPGDKTPTPATAQSPPPRLQTDIPTVDSKRSAKSSDRSPESAGGPSKPRRRKSKVASAIE